MLAFNVIDESVFNPKRHVEKILGQIVRGRCDGRMLGTRPDQSQSLPSVGQEFGINSDLRLCSTRRPERVPRHRLYQGRGSNQDCNTEQCQPGSFLPMLRDH